ncbi:hypothetical protein CY35_20G008600 [Sphagnum magellanicum]|nr:hypothetical protein CY35_20G008500 [Sphagnum magellanicum]KAH9530526.1 hypothetical protein CY35_20G008600 [Sphagnum magellanicum]
MGVVVTIVGLLGFGWGVSIGLIVGFFFFIYLQPMEVKDPIIRTLSKLESQTLQELLPEIPLWVKNPDYDRVDWVNNIVKDLWPYLDKAICKIACDHVLPYIEHYGPKFKIDSMEFLYLTMGKFPPTFVGVKVYDTEDKEMILETPFKFAGNPNIVFVVKAFGLKTTLQLVDLQIFGTTRITLKPLISIFPCFSKIFISLMQRPHIDFGLKVLGGDLMAIPGVSTFVQNFIKEQVADFCIWPKMFEIPLMKDPSVTKRPIGIVEVKIVRAKNFPEKYFMGNAYVKIQIANTFMAKTTRTKINTFVPEWNEHFKFIVHDPKSQLLELHVYDWEKVGAHEKIGMQVVPLASLIDLERKMFNLKLLKNMDPNDERNQKDWGEISIELMYKAFQEVDEADLMEYMHNRVERVLQGENGGLLVVTIHEAKDVEGKHHTNPYA